VTSPSPRRLKFLFAALYFSEGAPIGFLWWALPPQLRARGVPVEDVTALTAALALPWGFKFLWAPLVDMARGARFGRRAWITAAQLVMAASLVPLLFVDPVADFHAVFWLLLVHAFAAATQDVAVDAYAISVCPPEQRGSLNAWMQTGMLAGRFLFSGGVLIAASRLDSRAGVAGLIAAVAVSLIVLRVLAPPAPTPPSGPGGRRIRAFARDLAEVGRRRSTWLALAFALVGGTGFEAAGALAGSYLVDRGLASEQIGLFYTLIVPAMILGALAGGRWSDRAGHARAAAGAVGVVASALLVFAGADAWGIGGVVVPVAALVLVYLAIGMFTATSYALFMSLTRTSLGATQFSTYMGATNLCESWSGWVGGRLAGRFGYAAAVAVLALVSLITVPALRARSLVRDSSSRYP